MDRYFVVLFVVAALFFFLGAPKAVFSLAPPMTNLVAITGRKAEDSPAGSGEALGSL